MKITKITITALTADTGYCLTQSGPTENRQFAYKAFLAPTDSPDYYKEITVEEAREMGFEPLEIADEDLPKAYAMDLICNGDSDLKMKLTADTVQQMSEWVHKTVEDLAIDDLGRFVPMLPTFPFNGETLISAGTKFLFENVVYLAMVNTTDYSHLKPSPALIGTLYIILEYKDGVRCIPERFYGTSDAFRINSMGWWRGNFYKSLADYNVYTPDVVPANWQLIE